MKPLQIVVQFIREGEIVVAHCPSLDVSAYGATMEEAQRHFEEALEAFLQETVKHGTLERVLREHGWTQVDVKPSQWNPPMVITEKPYTISVPA